MVTWVGLAQALREIDGDDVPNRQRRLESPLMRQRASPGRGCGTYRFLISGRNQDMHGAHDLSWTRYWLLASGIESFFQETI